MKIDKKGFKMSQFRTPDLGYFARYNAKLLNLSKPQEWKKLFNNLNV